jgi:hypothetical protein
LNRLDARDRSGLALVVILRELLATAVDHCLERIVVVRREMRGGARRHAAADLAAVEYDHLPALSGQLIGGGQACDPGSDDHRIGARIGFQRLRAGRDFNVHPERAAAFICDIHGVFSPALNALIPVRPCCDAARRACHLRKAHAVSFGSG